eukprot:3678743-Alexandrium_andersonii.AAC.1
MHARLSKGALGPELACAACALLARRVRRGCRGGDRERVATTLDRRARRITRARPRGQHHSDHSAFKLF